MSDFSCMCILCTCVCIVLCSMYVPKYVKWKCLFTFAFQVNFLFLLTDNSDRIMRELEWVIWVKFFLRRELSFEWS